MKACRGSFSPGPGDGAFYTPRVYQRERGGTTLDMGSLLAFRRPNRVPPRAVFGLGTKLVERDRPRGTRAILEIDGLAIFCVVAEMPVVGDVVHGDLTAIVEKVRVTREGHVFIEARRATPEGEVARARWAGGRFRGERVSPRVDAVLREMRRHRRLRDSRRRPTDDLPHSLR